MISILLASLLLSSSSWAVTRVGNGGDSMAAEFVMEADDLMQVIDTLVKDGESELPANFPLEKVREKILTARIYTQEQTRLASGQEVDALNYPEDNKIIISRSRWKSVAYNIRNMRTLILHEYLGLARAKDGSYEISTRVVRKITNGGSKGELALLEDLDDRRFSNPYKDASFIIPSRIVSGVEGKTYFQAGKIVGELNLDLQKPYCSIESTGAKINASVDLKLQVLSATHVLDVTTLGFFNLGAVVKEMSCSSGNLPAKPSLKDALDSFGTLVTLNHTGSGKVINTCPATDSL